MKALSLLATIAQAGTIFVNLQLGTNKIALQSSYQFTLTLSTPLQLVSTVYFDFDQSLGVQIPNPLVCIGITGFSSNPSCTRISNTRVAMSCTTVVQSTFPNYAVQINGITNPGAAFTLTNQIKVSSYVANSLQDQSLNVRGSYQANEVESDLGSLQSMQPVVGQLASLKATLQTTNQIPANGQIIVKFPKWDNPKLNPDYLNSMVQAVTTCLVPLNAPTCSVKIAESGLDTVIVANAFANSGINQAGTTIEVTIQNVRNPPSLQPRSGFEIHTADSQGNLIDRCVNLTLKIEKPAAAQLGISYVNLLGQTGFSQPGTYQFFYQVGNPIPPGGSIVMSLPSQLQISNPSQIQYNGLANVAAQQQLTFNSNQIQLKNAVKNYLAQGSGIMFTIQGITNPSTSATTNSFVISTFDELNYPIENLSYGLSVQAQPGKLTNVVFSPTIQQGVRQYASEFQFQAQIETLLDADALITVQLSQDVQSFQILTDQQCQVMGMAYGVSDNMINCNQTQATRTIQISGFALNQIPAKTLLQFKIKNLAIRNPASIRTAASVFVQTSSQYQLDSGQSQLFYAIPGQLLQVQITPSNFFTGQTNVNYLFTVQPPNTITQNATLQIIFPPQVLIRNPNLVNSSCDRFFTSGLPTFKGSPPSIKCKVQQNQVIITDMFAYGSSIDSQPFQFTLPGLQNPRSSNQPSQSFQLYLFEDLELKYGIYNLTQGTFVTMLSASQFSNLIITPGSTVNKANTNYLFSIQTLSQTNTSDTITITFPVQLALIAPTCTVDQVQVECILIASSTLKVNILPNLNQFQIQVTGITNPLSTKPTNSFQIVLNDNQGNKVQEQLTNLTVQTSQPAIVPSHKMQIIPSKFDSGLITNYIVQYNLGIFVNNMQIKVMFPKQIIISQNATCSNMVVCQVQNSTQGQSVTTSSISGFQIDGVRNPSINVNISLSTFTPDGYVIEVLNNFEMNFECALPCMKCVNGSNTKCAQCFPNGKTNLFNQMCYEGCPPGHYLEDETCLRCQQPCLECDSWRKCTTCIDTSVYINDLCVSEPSFPYFCPALILCAVWLTTLLIMKTKRNLNLILLILHGLCWANFMLVFIEISVYYSYQMTGIVISEIVFGIILPVCLSSIFVILYFKWVHSDELVQNHIDKHKILSYYAIGTCFVSVRCWKILYSEIGQATSLTQLRDKFKKQNMHFSFASLLPDVCLGLIAAASLQVGASHKILLITVLACERIILSILLIVVTLLEYSCKRTTKDGKQKIQVYSSYQENSQSDLKETNNVGRQENNNETTQVAIYQGQISERKNSAQKGGTSRQKNQILKLHEQNLKNTNRNQNSQSKQQLTLRSRNEGSFNLDSNQSKKSNENAQLSQKSQRDAQMSNRSINQKNGQSLKTTQVKNQDLHLISVKKSPIKSGASSKTNQLIGEGLINREHDTKRNDDPTMSQRNEDKIIEDPRLVTEESDKKDENKVRIFYSDKSETSLEELMEITPSAFNLQNGRIHEESVGLRSLRDSQNQPVVNGRLQFKNNDTQNQLKDDQRPVVSTILKYQSDDNYNMKNSSTLAVPKTLAVSKKYTEDLKSSSSLKQRKNTQSSEPNNLFKRTGKQALENSHRVLPKNSDF